MPISMGPDGYACAEDDIDHAIHLLLNDYLRELMAASEGKASAPPAAKSKGIRVYGNAQERRSGAERAVIAAAVARLATKLSRGQRARVVPAIHRRVEWIVEHAADPSNAGQWQSDLMAVIEPFEEAAKRALADDLLRDMFEQKSETAIWRCLGDSTAAFLKTYDLTPEVFAGLHQVQAAMSKLAWDGAGFQRMSVAQNLHLVLWHDEWDELDEENCCTDMIRRDFRAMTGERRDKWKALFRNIEPLNSHRLSKPRAKAAQKLLAGVGIEDLRGRIREWFGVFRAPQPRRLSVGGSHVLKELVWYAALAKDPAAIEGVLWFTEATWKAKRNADKVWFAMIEVLPATEVLPPRQLWEALIRPWERGTLKIGDHVLEKTAAALGIDAGELKERRLLKPEPG